MIITGFRTWHYRLGLRRPDGREFLRVSRDAGSMLRMPLPPIAAANLRHPWRLGPAVWLATGGWIGFLPGAPGTWGAILGIPLAWGFGHFPPALHVAAVVGICLLGVPVCSAAVRRLGGPKDPGCIVLD